MVQLTSNTAKLEDTLVKLGQTLQVVPEAAEPGGTGSAAFSCECGMNQPVLVSPAVPDDQ